MHPLTQINLLPIKQPHITSFPTQKMVISGSYKIFIKKKNCYICILEMDILGTQFGSYAQKVSGSRPNEPNTMNL